MFYSDVSTRHMPPRTRVLAPPCMGVGGCGEGKDDACTYPSVVTRSMGLPCPTSYVPHTTRPDTSVQRNLASCVPPGLLAPACATSSRPSASSCVQRRHACGHKHVRGTWASLGREAEGLGTSGRDPNNKDLASHRSTHLPCSQPSWNLLRGFTPECA